MERVVARSICGQAALAGTGMPEPCALVLGLGPVGLEVLQSVRDWHPLGSSSSRLRLLHLDAGSDPGVGPSRGVEAALRGVEAQTHEAGTSDRLAGITSLVLEGMTSAASVWTQQSYLLEWLDHVMPDAGETGATTRQSGRLAFYANFQACSQRLQELLCDPVPKVAFIVGAVTDVRTSGMLFDLGWLLRSQLGDAGTVVAYLQLDEAKGELQQASAYAALKELDFLAGGGELLVRYAPQAKDYEVVSAPFASCYLAGSSKDIAVHLCASTIDGEVGRWLEASRSRQCRSAIASPRDNEGCFSSYVRIESFRTWTDEAKVREAAIAKTGLRFLQGLLERPPARVSPLNLQSLNYQLASSQLAQELAAIKLEFATRRDWSRAAVSSFVDRLVKGGIWSCDTEAAQASQSARSGHPSSVNLGRDPPGFVLEGPEGLTNQSNLAFAVERFAAEAEADLDEPLSDGTPTLADFGGWVEQVKTWSADLQARQVEATRSSQAAKRRVRSALADLVKGAAWPLAILQKGGKQWHRSIERLWFALEDLTDAKDRQESLRAMARLASRLSEVCSRRQAAQQAFRESLFETRSRFAGRDREFAKAAAPTGDGAELRLTKWLQALPQMLDAQVDFFPGVCRCWLARCNARSLEQLVTEPALVVREALELALGDYLAQSQLLAGAPGLGTVELPWEGLAASDQVLVAVSGGASGAKDRDLRQLDRLLQDLEEANFPGDMAIVDLGFRTRHELLAIRQQEAQSLRRFPEVAHYYQGYRRYLEQPSCQPVHIVKDAGVFDTLPGIFPPEPPLLARAAVVFWVAQQWQIIESRRGLLLWRRRSPESTFLDTQVLGLVERPEQVIHRLASHQELACEIETGILEYLEEIKLQPDFLKRRLGELVWSEKNWLGRNRSWESFEQNPALLGVLRALMADHGIATL